MFFLYFQGMPQGWIAYASSTQGSFHDTTKLYTPYISRTGPQCKLNFYYFMNGPSVDSLHVMVSVNGIQTQLWAMSGSRGMLWHQAQVFIGAKSMAIISIQARRGSSFQGVITVDDVQFIDCQPPIVTPTACMASQFACSNQYCVDMSKQCNYADDCGDGSDEYVSITLCPIGNFSCFFCCLLIFFKIKFLEKLFQECDQSVKQFGSRSGLAICCATADDNKCMNNYPAYKSFPCVKIQHI